MAGIIPIGELTAASDLTTGALVDRSLSRSQQAVDRRVNAAVVPLVAQAIADDPTIIQAALDAIDNAIDINGLSTAHLGIDEDGTPFYDPGNRTHYMGLDLDGVPYFTIGE